MSGFTDLTKLESTSSCRLDCTVTFIFVIGVNYYHQVLFENVIKQAKSSDLLLHFVPPSSQTILVLYSLNSVRRNCLRRIARHDELQFSKDSIVNVMEKFVKTVNVMDETILVPCRLMDRQVGDGTDIVSTPGKDITSNQHTFIPNASGKRNPVKSKNVHEFLNSSELFNLYNVLNALKNDLLWTCKSDSEDLSEQPISIENQEAKTENISTNIPTALQTSNCIAKGHTRRPSTASMASIASVSQMSDSESDISQENDSGVESECNKNGSGLDSANSSEDGHIQSLKLNNTDKATELAKRCRRHLNGLYQCLEQMTEAANYLTARYQSDIGGPV